MVRLRKRKMTQPVAGRRDKSRVSERHDDKGNGLQVRQARDFIGFPWERLKSITLKAREARSILLTATCRMFLWILQARRLFPIIGEPSIHLLVIRYHTTSPIFCSVCLIFF